MKIRNEYTCPLELIHDMVRGTWKPIILWKLSFGETSVSKLEKDISGITKNMLRKELKELMEFGIIDEIIYDEYPLRTEYFITKNRGEKILDALSIMQNVGMEFMIEFEEKDRLKERGTIE